MTLAATPPPEAPATPTDFRVSAETADSITWTWNAVAGAQGYLVQISTDEMFEDMFEGDDQYAVRVGTSNTSYTATDLEPGTTLHVRVAAGVLTTATPSLNPEDYLLSEWTMPATGMTVAPAAATTTHVTDFVRGGNLAGRRGHRTRSLLHERELCPKVGDVRRRGWRIVGGASRRRGRALRRFVTAKALPGQ